MTRRCRWSLLCLCALAVVVCGCKDRKGQAAPTPQANPDGVAQSGASVQTPVSAALAINPPQMHRAAVPRLVIFDPIVEGSDPVMQGRAEFLAGCLRTAWFCVPEILVDVQSTVYTRRLMAREGSLSHRPLRELADEDLAKRARACDAGHFVWLFVRRDDDAFKVSMRIVETNSASTVWRGEFRGTWQQLGAQIAENTPEMARLLGLTFDARQEATLRQPKLGIAPHFEQVADLNAAGGGKPGDGARLMDQWFAANPELAWVEGFALGNHTTEENTGGLARVVARINQPGPFHAILAVRAADAFERSGDVQASLRIREVLALAQPTSLRCQIEAGIAAYSVGDMDKALAYAQSAEKISAGHWMVHMLFGDIYTDWADKAQHGNTFNELSLAEQKQLSDGVQLSTLRFSKAIELNPWDAYPKGALGNSLMRGGGATEQVFRLCREAYDLNPWNDRPIATMIWACAPGYSRRQQQGIDIFMEFHAKLNDPVVMLDISNPMRQIMAGKMKYVQNDIFDFTDKNPMVATAFADMCLRGLAAKNYNADLKGFAYFYAGEILEYLYITSEYAPFLRENFGDLANQNDYEKQWCEFTAGWIMEEYGDIDTASRFYDGAVTGPDTGMRRKAECRNLVVSAKRGDVTKALSSLDGGYKDMEQYAVYRMEILLEGTPAQRQQAVALGEETMKTYAVRPTVYRLGKAYNATGQYAKAKALVLRYCDVGKTPSRGMEVIWKAAQKGLGETEVWPPPDDLIRRQAE